MIIGTLMALETCLILGQVSLNFIFWEEKPPDGYVWSRWRSTRKQLTSRPDHLWPELWKSMGKHAKLKEKPKWSNEKLHLENARKLRGINFIEPEDKEFKETIKNARKKLETSVLPALPCKIMKQCGRVGSNKINKTCLHSGSWWIYENAYGKLDTALSSRPYCRKRRKFITALQFGSQNYSYASSYENSCSKSSGGQGMGKLEKISAWNLTKVRSKKEVINEARTSGATVHFASLMNMSSEKCWIGGKTPKNTKVELYSEVIL